jgi:DNA-binding transcriptional LysR family regulator
MHYGGSRATRCMRDERQLRHECARRRHRSVALGEDRIVLHRSTRIARNVHLPAIVAVNGAESLVAAARVGLGLIQVPCYRVEGDLEQRALVPVPPDFPPSPTPVSLLCPPNRQLLWTPFQ